MAWSKRVCASLEEGELSLILHSKERVFGFSHIQSSPQVALCLDDALTESLIRQRNPVILDLLNEVWDKYEEWFEQIWEQANQQCYPDSSSTQERIGETQSGYVYLLRGGHYYKIGLSNDPDRRIGEISPRLPFKTKLICTVATEDMCALEAKLHKRFADKRTNGEWFELDDEDVEYIKELADANSKS